MKKVAALLALALAAVALVACGDDDGTTTTSETGAETTTETGGGKAGGNGGGSGAAGVVKLSIGAGPGCAVGYTTTEASSKAGQVTVEFDNPQSTSHDVAFVDSGSPEVGGTELIPDG